MKPKRLLDGTKDIYVVAAVDQDALARSGADVEYRHCETIEEAKIRAKYLLTIEYQWVSESSVRLGYSQVLVNGKVLYDYFGKVQSNV